MTFWRRIFGSFFLACLTLFQPVQAGASVCRQALSIGLDISGSVDEVEYRLQLDGLAAALLDQQVIQAFLAMPDALVDLHVYEWAGVDTQRTLLDWRTIASNEDLLDVADHLRGLDRLPRQVPTALGLALVFGARSLGERPGCWRHTLDIVADGTSNAGPRPREVRNEITLGGVTINALVIGDAPPAYVPDDHSEVSQLQRYFNAEVIFGPDAFVEQATSYQDFQAAMTRKLLKELQTLIIGGRDPTGPNADL